MHNQDMGLTPSSEKLQYQYKMWSPPAYVGRWEIASNFFVSTIKKPNWFHRKMTSLFFGWKWHDDSIV